MEDDGTRQSLLKLGASQQKPSSRTACVASGNASEEFAGSRRRAKVRAKHLIALTFCLLFVGVTAWCELRFALLQYVINGGYPEDTAPVTDKNPRYHIQMSLQRQLGNFCAFLDLYYERCYGDYDCYAKLLPRRRRVWYRGRLRPVFERPVTVSPLPRGSRLDPAYCLTSNSLMPLSAEQIERVRLARNCPVRPRYLWFVYIVRDEARLLVQNILHHLGQGVEHFLVYDNESSDNLSNALEPFQKLGLVSLYNISGQGVQLRAYDDALSRARRAGVSWLGAIDADEFFISTRAPCIPSVLEKLQRENNATMAALAVNWRFPGRYPKLLNATTFPAESAVFSIGSPNKHVKSIVYAPRTRFFRSPHHASYDPGMNALSVSGEVVEGPFQEPPSAENTALFHFQSKNVNEWIQKRIRGRADVSWAFMKTQPEIFFNDDLVSFFTEWLGYTKATGPKGHPLALALRNHTIALKRAIWGW